MITATDDHDGRCGALVIRSEKALCADFFRGLLLSRDNRVLLIANRIPMSGKVFIHRSPSYRLNGRYDVDGIVLIVRPLREREIFGTR